MNNHKNRANLILCVLCTLLIGWTVYSYLCIGVIHQYDMHFVKNSTAQIELLNNLWLSLIYYLVISCSGIVLCTLLFTITKSSLKLRIALYLVSIISGAIMLYHSNQICISLLDVSMDNSYEINNLLRPSYNLCIIVNILMTVILLMFEYVYHRVHHNNR